MRNRGELAEGWYDPETLRKAQIRPAGLEPQVSPRRKRGRSTPELRSWAGRKVVQSDADVDEEEDEDEYGPRLPSQTASIHPGMSSRGPGPAIPNLSDLRERQELRSEEATSTRSDVGAALRAERKAERKLQRERLDEVAPRAEARTRERQLEKKREKATANRLFAEARERSPEFGEDDLMGAGDDAAELKRMKKEDERKKSEREIRKEEVLRARMAEREERMKGMKEKEEKTIVMLKELAKARFGGP